jgi:hypothetical protein
MAGAPRFIQHWKSGKGKKTSFVFLFTDGIALAYGELDREQEMVHALRSSPTSSPQAVLGEGSWWLPFANMKAIYISREKKAMTVVMDRGECSATFNTGVDVDYFLQMIEDDVHLVSWDVHVGHLGFWHDSIRLVLSSLSLLLLAAGAVVGYSAFQYQDAPNQALPYLDQLMAQLGLAGTLVVLVVPVLIIQMMVIIRGLLLPKFTIYAPMKSASLLNMAASAGR